LGILVSFVESVSSRHGSPIGQPAYSERGRLAGFAVECKPIGHLAALEPAIAEAVARHVAHAFGWLRC
jgi:hypothetical protein